MAKPKCTQDRIDNAAEMKRHGLMNRGICQVLCISETTLYRWLQKSTNRLHCALSEALKKVGAEYKGELPESIMDAATRQKNPQWTASRLLKRK